MDEGLLWSLIEHLADERRRQCFSLKQLADKIGTSASAVHAWERYDRLPSLWNAMKWADALGYQLNLERSE